MNVSINKPCHENWAEMTPNQQGAFCGKCIKTVIDFSSKSINEIKEFFNTTQQQRICGRFETEQLTNLSFDNFYSKFKKFHFSKRIAFIVCLTFGAWLFGGNSVSAQTQPIEHIKGDVAYVPEKKDTTKKCIKPPPEKNMIMGKVAAPKNPSNTIKTKPIDNRNKTNHEHFKMGEVMATPTQTVKPKPKTTKKK